MHCSGEGYGRFNERAANKQCLLCSAYDSGEEECGVCAFVKWRVSQTIYVLQHTPSRTLPIHLPPSFDARTHRTMAEVTNLPGVDRERREEWGPDTSNSMSEDMPQRHPSARSISSAMDPEPAHIDPYLAVRKMLWMLPDINDLVESAVERIQRVCAYNSVYFLKVVLDLQWTYLSLQPSPPEEVMLEKKHVMKIADFMATRMARRETEPGSLSRELQLRTLTSALMLLHRYEIRNLDDDTYAKLLHSVSERDSENEVRFLDGDNRGEYMAEGDIEYLALYACDLIRCLPPNKPDSEVLAEFGQPAVYFMIAAGMIVSAFFHGTSYSANGNRTWTRRLGAYQRSPCSNTSSTA